MCRIRKIFKVFLRIYFDDFLLDSGIKNADQKNLDFSGNSLFTREVLAKYVNERIKISVNKRQIPAELGEMDLSDNELRMNLFFSSSGKSKYHYCEKSYYDFAL